MQTIMGIMNLVIKILDVQPKKGKLLNVSFRCMENEGIPVCVKNERILLSIFSSLHVVFLEPTGTAGGNHSY